MLWHHLGDHGTTPDGRLFRGARGGMLSESVYGRAWHAARRAALGPDLAATALARRPAARRPVAVAERQRRTRGGRRAGREQRPCLAGGLPALHVRHEALFVRMEVEDLDLPAVAAAG
jgi:hypothetical protein